MPDKHCKVIEMFPALGDAIIAANTDTVTVGIHEVRRSATLWCTPVMLLFGK